MKKIINLFIIFLAVFLVTGCNNNSVNDISSSPSLKVQDNQLLNKGDKIMPKTSLTTPKMEIDKTKKYQAVLSTSVGEITISLNAAKTPITVNNFVYLSKESFYNNTIFHRVIKGFMIQGGDPNGDGTGGPGYKFKDEPFQGEYRRGIVAMANSGPNTNGSQFFIMHQDKPLPKDYVIFAQVIEGMDTVDKIANGAVKQSPSGENSQPVNPVKINSVKIIEK